MNKARELTYAFLDLPHVVRMRIARDLGLLGSPYAAHTEESQNIAIFQRAKEEGKLATFRDAIEGAAKALAEGKK